jgi:hypothetical protein
VSGDLPPEHGPPSGVARLKNRETLLRALNERIAELTWQQLGVEGPVDFVCECSRAGCWEPLPLTRGQFDEVRAHPRRFVLLRGHEVEGVDRVIERHDAYVVVETPGIPAPDDAASRLA